MSSTAAKRRPTALVALFSVLGAVLIAFVLLPVLTVILGTSPASVVDALGEGTVRWSLWLTLYAALIATAIAFVFGVPLAYVLARREFRGKAFIEGLIDVPIVFPHTAAGVALLMVYGQDGILGRLLAPLGITFTDSVPGIIVAMMFVSLPFLVDTAREAFALVDPRYEQVARTLGASPGVAFLRTTMPLARRGVLAGLVMMWARGISEFGAVVILAYNPKIVPVLVYERFEGFGLDAAKPVAVIIVLVALVVFIVLRTALAPRRSRRRRRVTLPEASASTAAGLPTAAAQLPATLATTEARSPDVAGPLSAGAGTAVAGPGLAGASPGLSSAGAGTGATGPGLAAPDAAAGLPVVPQAPRASAVAVGLDGLQARAGDFESGPLDLELRGAEYFVLLGPSGSGKTVLLEALAGLRTATTGRVLFDGQDATGLPPERRGVGFVYQDGLLFPNLDVAGNIAFGLGPRTPSEWAAGPRRSRRAMADPRVGAAAQLTGAGHLLHRDPLGLSGGERQRVALARALVTEPRLLLLDEPLANLDQETREGLQGMLSRLHERFPTTVLHVTHDFPEATVLADRCAVLGGGRLHQVGTPAEVFRKPADAFVARFTGGRNVFSGAAAAPTAGAPGSATVVDLDGGPQLFSGAGLRGRVGVVVRPEDIDVTPVTGALPAAGAGDVNELDGVIDEVLDQGGTALVRVAVPRLFTALLTRRQLDALSLARGGRVRLRFPAAAVHLFQATEGADVPATAGPTRASVDP
jgi:ABC-type sugar transport system ATPase subunit/ABC-type sulfate transport system permease component